MKNFKNVIAHYIDLMEFEGIPSKWSVLKAKADSRESLGMTEISKFYLEKFCFENIILVLEIGGKLCRQHRW